MLQWRATGNKSKLLYDTMKEDRLSGKQLSLESGDLPIGQMPLAVDGFSKPKGAHMQH